MVAYNPICVVAEIPHLQRRLVLQRTGCQGLRQAGRQHGAEEEPGRPWTLNQRQITMGSWEDNTRYGDSQGFIWIKRDRDEMMNRDG